MVPLLLEIMLTNFEKTKFNYFEKEKIIKIHSKTKNNFWVIFFRKTKKKISKTIFVWVFFGVISSIIILSYFNFEGIVKIKVLF